MPPPRRDRKIRNSVGNFRPRASSRRSSSSSLAGSVNMCCCRPFATTATTSSIVTGDLLEPVEEEEERRALLEGVTGFGGIEERDRKSTRLNSSHEWISYAVFCLKKKK